MLYSKVKQSLIARYAIPNFLLFFLFTACEAPVQKEISIKNLSIVTTGPLFEGANMGQFAWKVDLQQYGLTAQDHIVGARLEKAQLTIAHDSISKVIQNISIQLASEKAPMKKLGYLNPSPQNVTVYNLEIAKEQQEVALYFNEKEIYFVVDYSLVQDYPSDLTFNADFTFNIQTKKN